MTQNAGGAILALLMGFILSAGLVGFVLAAGGYQLPLAAPRPLTVTAPGLAVAPPAAPVQAQAQAAPAASAPAEVKVVATELKFAPPTIQAKVGQPIKIVLDNKGAIEHDIAFPTVKADKPGASLKAVARAGQTATLEFTPTAKGSYEYICTIPGHKEAGMKGKINVVD
ncbi:MAG TPA: cupredoxin domain-containing protein [Chloroflexota bacterium]|nr:cupredoxin domain-containing protein [Chloroflexota bacterium]